MNRSLLVFILLLATLTNTFSQGQLWGLTAEGGSDNIGAIFKINEDGSGFSIEKSFLDDSDKPTSTGALVEVNGKFYGVTSKGGKKNMGTLFEYDRATGTYTRRFEFDGANGNCFQCGIIDGGNGKLFGFTDRGGIYQGGVLFQYNLQTHVFSKLLDLSYYSLGSTPRAVAILGNNKLYAVTAAGGSGNSGTLAEFDFLTGKGVKKFDFNDNTTGSDPISLISSLSGKLYGVNKTGGPKGSGVLFEFDPASGVFTNKVNFDYTNVNIGYIPTGLVSGAGGKLYGWVSRSIAPYKTVFEFDSSTGSYSILNTSSEGDSLGEPYGCLIFANGKLYGRQINLNYTSKKRVIFEFNIATKKLTNKSANDLTSIYYSSSDYDARLSVGADGNLYGFEKNSGTYSNGYFFKFDVATGAEKKLFDFTTVSNGSKPLGTLTNGADGKLYGITPEGGNYGYGTLFEYDPITKKLTKKYDFPSDFASVPNSSLVLAANGRFYGSTGSAGVVLYGSGTIFEYDPLSERVEIVYDFEVSNQFNQRYLTLAANGKLYGVESYGGLNYRGVIFEFDPSIRVFTKKHDFTEAEGSFPLASLTAGPNGKLYGTCNSSSSANKYAGTLFEYNYETNIVTKLVDFDPNVTGSNPQKKLCFASDGKLYGIARENFFNGVLFQFDPVTGSLVKKLSYGKYGVFQGSLVEGRNKKLFGFRSNDTRSDLFVYDAATTFVKNKAIDNTMLQTNADVDLLYTPELLAPKENQSIVFPQLSPVTLGDDPVYFSATATSGLTVRYSSSDPSIARVEDNKLTILKTGSVTITAYQDGNIYYDSAPIVQQVLVINQTSGSQLWGIAGDRIFSLDKDGSNFAFRKQFLDDSQRPYTDQFVSYNGKLYGVTYSGGTFNQGAIFEYDPSTKLYTKKYDFNGVKGGYPRLITMGPNGKIYGVNWLPNKGSGFFEYTISSGSCERIIDLGADSENYPYKATWGKNGKLYGTSFGGISDYGYLFELDPVLKTYKTIFNFDQNTGSFGSVVGAGNGIIYGYSIFGGANGVGVLYEYDPTKEAFSKIFDFTTEVGYAYGEIVYRSEKLYGLFYTNENSIGIYEFDLVAKTIRKKTYPVNANTNVIVSLVMINEVLVLATDGGVTQKGAFLEFNPATFEFTKKGESDNLFWGSYSPPAILNGKIYGPFLKEAESNNGAIAAYDPLSATVQEEISFMGATTGTNLNDLAVGKNDKLYGTTSNGGVSNGGVIFELDPTNSTFVKKFDFDITNGFAPTGALVLTNEGKFYGITSQGGSYNKGVIFEYNPSTNKLTKKADFDGTNGDNIAWGSANFLFNENSNKWYGTTMRGGANNKGVIFEFDPVSSTLIKKFDLSDDSGYFNYFRNALTALPSGKIYGVTNQGGKNDWGTLFEFDPADGTFSKKMDFSYENTRITSGFKLATNGKLYSTGSISQREGIVEYNPIEDKIVFVGNLDPIRNYSNNVFTETGTKKLYAMLSSSIVEFDPASGNVSNKYDYIDRNVSYSSALTYIKDNQTITFDKLAARTIGEPPFELTATASSGLPVTFTSSDPTVSIKDNKITILKDGVATITAKQTGNSVYNPAADVQQPLFINKLTPTVSWANPSDIVYGITLSNAQLNATASVEGTLAYTPVSGTKLNAGSNQTLSVTFTPADAVNYSTLTSQVTINVAKAIPSVTWSNPLEILYGTTLSNAQLNATASVEGTLAYTPVSGTKLNAGSNQTLSVTFTPTDAVNYAAVTSQVTINVAKASPSVTWSNPSEIVYGTVLNNVQLNATASVAGTFSYSPASGTKLNAGSNQTVSVTFTPTDAVNYAPITSQITIDVAKASPSVTWSNPSEIVYGTALSNVQLNATASVGGTFSYSPVNGTKLNAGSNQTISVTFTPTDAVNYAAVISEVTINVAKSSPTVTWSNPSEIVYGTALSNVQLNATASVGGTFSYSPASGTKLNAGSNQTLSVTFTPTNVVNYIPVSKSVLINIPKANQQLTFESIKDKIFSEGTLSLSAFSNSNLPVVFEVTPADKASLSGNILTFVKSGRIKVTASQAGNGNFSPASSIDQSFCINPNKPTISVTDLNTSSPKLTSSAVAGNQWFFNDALISSSTGQAFTATESGKYKVQVKADDCSSEFSLEQVLVVTGDIQKTEADVQLFPNPVTDWLTITLNDDGEKKIITLFNSAGQQLSMQETASEVARVEVSDFSKGVYIAKVIIGNQMKVIRFVKQ